MKTPEQKEADRVRSARFRATNQERVNAKAREKRARERAAGKVSTRPMTPEQRAERAAYSRKYWLANRERLNAQNKAYYEAHKNDPAFRAWKSAYAAKRNGEVRMTKILTGNERKVEDYLCDKVQARKGFCPKFHHPGRRGAPDRIVMLPGYPSYYVELKRPVGGKLEPWQITYHREIARAGQEVFVLWNRDDVDAFMAAHPPKCDLL